MVDETSLVVGQDEHYVSLRWTRPVSIDLEENFVIKVFDDTQDIVKVISKYSSFSKQE